MRKKAPIASLLTIASCFVQGTFIAGCDGVGRAIIDQPFDFSIWDIDITKPCEDTPDCTSILDVLRMKPLAPDMALPDPACGGSTDHQTWAQLGCASLEIEIGVGDDGARDQWQERFRATSVYWERAHIRITTQLPLDLRLERAQLRDVYVELHGPVTFGVGDSEGLQNIGVIGKATSAGTPNLELDKVDVEALAVTGSHGRFEGYLHVAHSELRIARLESQELMMEASSLTEFAIDAPWLATTNSDLHRGLVRLDRGQVSLSTMRRCHVESCGALTLMASTALGVGFAPCERGALRLYDSKVAGGFIDGNVTLDKTEMARMQLGTSAASEVVAWQSAVVQSALCDHVRSARWGEGSFAVCLDCRKQGRALEPDDRDEPQCINQSQQAAEFHFTRDCRALDRVQSCRQPMQRDRRP